MKNGRCRVHGGATPRGPANPNFKHGRYSEAMPKGLKDAFERYMADDRRTEAAAEIALVRTRIEELVRSLNQGGVVTTRALASQLDAIESAIANQDVDGLKASIATMRASVNETIAVADTWAEATKLVEQQRKLVDTELRREQRAYETVTSAELAAAMSAFVDIVTKHVKDKKALTGIAEDMSALVN